MLLPEVVAALARPKCPRCGWTVGTLDACSPVCSRSRPLPTPCSAKKATSARRRAKRWARRVALATGEPMQAYRCPDHGWHIAHVVPACLRERAR
jgi:hypothetical protein